MYNLMTMVDNPVLCNWNLLGEENLCFHEKKRKKVNMWDEFAQ